MVEVVLSWTTVSECTCTCNLICDSSENGHSENWGHVWTSQDKIPIHIYNFGVNVWTFHLACLRNNFILLDKVSF